MSMQPEAHTPDAETKLPGEDDVVELTVDSSVMKPRSSFSEDVRTTITSSVWQNRFPTLMALIVGSTFLICYYTVPEARPFFEALSDLEIKGGVLFSAVAAVVCAGLAPMLLQIAVTRALPKPFIPQLLFVLLFWSFLGVYVKGQYTLNKWLNGDDTELGTVIRKVVCDQFVFSPFVNYIWISACFRFRDHDCSWTSFRESLKDRRSLQLQYCSMNVANWCTWLPGVALIYSLPTSLQMPCWAAIVFFYSSLLSLVSASSSVGDAGNACPEEDFEAKIQQSDP